MALHWHSAADPQGYCSTFGPVQLRPPLSGAGLLHSLVRILTMQGCLHSDHADQAPQPPFTENIEGHIEVISIET